MKKIISLLFIAAFISPVKSQTAKEIVSKLTLEEKVNLLIGMGMNIPGITPTGAPVIGQTMDKVAGAAGTTYAISRFGIPNTVLADGPAGVRIDSIRKGESATYYATAWPVGTLLASTWDTKLSQEVGKAFGNEVREYGIDVLLAPALNIHRNPLGGRNFEYYSEDPLVSGKIAAAVVNGVQANGVGASIKHFAVNNQETNRNSVNSIVSERALREIYLKGFEIAVKESNPWTVMSSYNLLNGTYTSESYDLLTTLLRKEWGFKGLVMTDWFGGTNAVEQVKAGNDLLMPGTPNQKKEILEAISKGTLNEKFVNENAERMINYIFRTPSYKKLTFTNKPDLKAHAELSRKAASEGIVLLKNEGNALPINQKIKRIALFGNTTYDIVAGGTGSGDVNKMYTISLAQGFEKTKFKIDPDFKNLYFSYITEQKKKQPKKNLFEEFMNPTPRIPEMDLDNTLLTKKALENDIAIITIGRNAGEGSDRKVLNDFNLTEKEQSFIATISNAFHLKNKKVIVVLNIGGVIETASWRNKVDAILLAWQPGLEGGNAIADVLTGKVNPSGKLATTFPIKYEDESSAKNFPGTEFPDKATTGMFGMKLIPAEVTYEEGIYVGYRYYNTFNINTAYEFGYGKSYTNFQYSNLSLSNAIFNGKIAATVTIKNTGKIAGKEVVQLYIEAPSKSLNKPKEELKCFAKTNLLQPNQSQTIYFDIYAKDLASFETERTSWIADAGKYTIKIGSSSKTFLQTATFNVAKEITVEKCNKVLVPQKEINELKK